MSAAPLVIAGLPIPSRAPLFLAMLAVHVPAGLAAVVAGVWAMLTTKGRGAHTRAGKLYYWSLTVVAATMAGLAALRWRENKWLFLLGVVAWATATSGRAAVRRGWRALHITAMGTSYVVMLTAFYVDNGANLPLWNRLPPIAYWMAAPLVGAPLIVRAIVRERRRRAAARADV